MEKEIRSDGSMRRIVFDSRIDKFVKASKAAMLCALALLFLGGFILELQTREIEVHTSQRVDAVIDHADAVVDHANGTIDDARTIAGMMESDVYGSTRHLNRLLDTASSQMQGVAPILASAKVSTDNLQVTTKLSQKLALDARLTIDNMNSAALDERFYFEHQIPELLDGINTTVSSVNDRVNDLAPIEASAEDITKSGAGIAADAQWEVHRYVHPPPQPWYKKIYNGAMDAGKLTYDFIR